VDKSRHRASGDANRGTGERGTTSTVRVFVSYRRDDVPDATDRLVDSLTKRLGKRAVFVDVDRIEPGAPFAEVIDDFLGRTDVLLAVIGHRWMEPRQEDRDALPRESSRNYVQLEIEAALLRDIRVIPVLIHGAPMPSEDALPKSMAPLAGRNAIELTRRHWDADVDGLVSAIEPARIPWYARLQWRVLAAAAAAAVVGAVFALLLSKESGPAPTPATSAAIVASAATPKTKTRAPASTGHASSPATPTSASLTRAASPASGTPNSQTTTHANAGARPTAAASAATSTAPQGKPVATPSTSQLGPLKTVETYWDDIGVGNFGAAYPYLTTTASEKLTKSAWVVKLEEEGIEHEEFRGGSASFNGSTADVPVYLLVTRDVKHGCQYWTGFYEATATANGWLIEPKIHSHQCKV